LDIIKHISIFADINYRHIAKSEKRDRFERVASNRVQKVIDFLALIGNCANRNNYEYTEADVEYMFTEMSKALKAAREEFTKEMSKSTKTQFRFSEQDS
jgi:hypothetical protein